MSKSNDETLFLLTILTQFILDCEFFPIAKFATLTITLEILEKGLIVKENKHSEF